MVKRSLDLDMFRKKFQKAKSRSLNDVILPNGISRKRFDLFLKVMDARNSQELDDVSIEDLASLFVDTEKMISAVFDGSCLSKPDAMESRLVKMDAVCARRRIL